MNSKQRVAIVTGASRGIGRAVALRLARDGMSVVVNFASKVDEAEKVVSEIRAMGRQAFAFQADVADEVAVEAMFERTERELGSVDVVVNAAGIMALGNVAELKLAEFDRLHRTNVRGTFVVAQQAARKVRAGGAIITFSTSAERAAMPGYAAYAASKGAVEALSLILARELRGRDITVNAVAPGPVATELFLTGKDAATVERLAKLNPMERLGQPDDIAEIVSFLAGPCRWINGQVLFANGGMN
jgi:3-oxoacyl-[acyl-carrier protein] reductase